jgi:hypothetical protein
MKTLVTLFASKPMFRKLTPYLAATATVGLLALVARGLPDTAKADSGQANPPPGIQATVQTAELLQLLADFHGALSYGGNLSAMASLWTEDGSFTLNGVSYVGKDAVLSFFATSPYFTHNWVSLAPEYKTQITIHGNTADFSTQCVGVDLTTTPFVVRGVIQVNGTAVLQNGQWLYKSMNNTTPAPL